jgi:hypothetical protein
MSVSCIVDCYLRTRERSDEAGHQVPDAGRVWPQPSCCSAWPWCTL